MNDTSSNIKERVNAMMALKTPEKRLRMASSMFDAGRKLIEVGLAKSEGVLNKSQLRARVFVRLYGEYYNNDEIGKILSSINNCRIDPK